MIKKLIAKNFWSFDNIELSFESNVLGLWGANGSGKTNVLRIISYLRHIIGGGQILPNNTNNTKFFDVINKNGIYTPCRFNKDNKPIILSISFIVGDKSYDYMIEYNNENIILEEINMISHNVIISKKYNKTTKNHTIIIKKDNKLLNKEYRINKETEGSYKEYTLFKYVLEAIKDSDIKDDLINLVIYWKNITTNVSFDNSIDVPIAKNASNISQYILSENKKEDIKISMTKYRDLLDLKDIGLYDINISSTNMDNKTIIKGIHKKGKKEVVLDFFEQESMGTQALFMVFYYIVKSLESGAVLAMDEIGQYIHPLIMERIIGYFMDKDCNKNNAQLLFTTHNINTLTLLERYQTAFVNKEDGISEVYLMSDIEGTNDEIDVGAKKIARYLAGRYGGIPEYK